MIIFVLLAALAFPSIVFAQATTEDLFVRPSADCVNNGDGKSYACAATAGGPGAWRGFASQLYSGTDETPGRIDPGDTVHVCGNFVAGDAQSTPNIMINAAASGLANTATITYDGNCTVYGGTAEADISGSSTIVNGFYTAQRSFFTLKNVYIHHMRQKGILLFSSASGDVTLDKQILIQDVRVSDITGLTTPPCMDSRGQNITVRRVHVSYCGSDGFFHMGKNYLIEDSSTDHISSDGLNAGDSMQTSGEVGGLIIRRNHFDQSFVDSKYCMISESYTDTGVITMEDNVCIRKTTDTVGSGMYVDSKPGMTLNIRRNQFTGGLNGIQVTYQSGTVNIIANQIVSPSQDGILLGGVDVGGTTIVRNNTIITPGRYGISQSNTSVTATLQNNIVVGPATACISRQTSNTEDHNDLYNCTTAVLIAGVAGATGAGTITTNPQFLSGGYVPSNTSPCRGAGFNWGSFTDVRGRANSVPPDIGAYQLTTTNDISSRLRNG